MIITQDKLIKQISEKENINAATIRQIMKSTENIIFECFTSTKPSETIVIKLLNGISIERKYIQQKNYSKGMFQNISCPEHINIKANASKYYAGQINQKLFDLFYE